MQFYNYARREVNLIHHCLEQKAKHGENLSVFIGTDSLSIGGTVHYFVVIAFRYDHNGAHFIFSKEKVPTYRKPDGKPDIFTKLWRECQLTMELSESLVNQGIFTRNEIIIELDYNSVVETISKPLIPATKGWATGLGYQCLTKYGEYVFVNGERIYEQIAVKALRYIAN